MKAKTPVSDKLLSAFLGALCLVWVYPIIMILFNSLKKETAISMIQLTATRSKEVQQ